MSDLGVFALSGLISLVAIGAAFAFAWAAGVLFVWAAMKLMPKADAQSDPDPIQYRGGDVIVAALVIVGIVCGLIGYAFFWLNLNSPIQTPIPAFMFPFSVLMLFLAALLS